MTSIMFGAFVAAVMSSKASSLKGSGCIVEGMIRGDDLVVLSSSSSSLLVEVGREVVEVVVEVVVVVVEVEEGSEGRVG